MKEKTPLSVVIRGFLIIALVILIVIAAVTGIGWWMGWMELDDFQKAVQAAGLLVIGLGLFGIKGNPDLNQSIGHKHVSESNPISRERSQQTLLDFARSYSFLLIMVIAGVVCLLIGWLM
jgi:hypothetical protein